MLGCVCVCVCVCGERHEEGQTWAECVKKCGYWVCSFSCGLVLQNCPCKGSIDFRKRVGYCLWGSCQVIPWQLMLLDLVPINVSGAGHNSDLPGCLILWPNVPSLCNQDGQIRRSFRQPLGMRHNGQAQVQLRKENICLHELLK